MNQADLLRGTNEEHQTYVGAMLPALGSKSVTEKVPTDIRESKRGFEEPAVSPNSDCSSPRPSEGDPNSCDQWNEEELLKENNSRFVLFPIKYEEIWSMQQSIGEFLDVQEVDLVGDLGNWRA